MGFALGLLFVCGLVLAGVKALCLYKTARRGVSDPRDMAEVARTRARMLCPNQSVVEKSRARRRRRIKMRRGSDGDEDGGGSNSEERSVVPEGGSTVIGIPVAPPPCFSWALGNGGFVIRRESVPRFVTPLPLPPRLPVARALAPEFGVVSVAGRQRLMEDAVAVKTNLCSPVINRRRPVHYFGVFDGHGGAHVAMMCKEHLHAILKEELMGTPAEQNRTSSAARPSLPAPPGIITDESGLQETWRLLIGRVFKKVEEVALHTCGRESEGSDCNCPECDVLYTGTTAVSVVLTEKHIVAGNCGDSRAVLYRAGRIIPLTFDHKPDRADEKSRIQASGGRVINADTARVQGILAMSRAIGDVYLKPYVISEPDVTFTRRDGEDEFLIIATDGMWDVIPTEMAGRVARECLKEPPAPALAEDGSRDLLNNFGGCQEEEEEERRFASRSASAASLLARLAMARKSEDNISVVVVDLKRDADNN